MAASYTLEQSSLLTGIKQDTLKHQLNRDLKKDKASRRYPNAYKAECGKCWMIPAKDLNATQNLTKQKLSRKGAV